MRDGDCEYSSSVQRVGLLTELGETHVTVAHRPLLDCRFLGDEHAPDEQQAEGKPQQQEQGAGVAGRKKTEGGGGETIGECEQS